MIQVKHLAKSFGEVKPLTDVNCEIASGEVISIIGPSGCGKSTFLRCINGLEKASGGEIWFEGQNICDKKCDINILRRKIGMVFQSFNLFSHLTVLENITLGCVKLRKIDKEQANVEGMELLKTVGLAQKANAYPDELSGGQKQRVAIARTLAMQPAVILFDEPTSALDPTMVGEVLAVIRSLADKGYTMLIVTHEMQFAEDVSSRVFYMEEGGIYEEGAPDIIFKNPQKEKTRAFIKRLKMLEVTLTDPYFDFVATNNDIAEFAKKQNLTKRHTFAVQSVFEELCVLKLVPVLGENFNLFFHVEYSDKDKTLNLLIEATGEPFNPFEDSEDISVKLIQKKAATIDYNYDGTVNRWQIRLK